MKIDYQNHDDNFGPLITLHRIWSEIPGRNRDHTPMSDYENWTMDVKAAHGARNWMWLCLSFCIVALLAALASVKLGPNNIVSVYVIKGTGTVKWLVGASMFMALAMFCEWMSIKYTPKDGRPIIWDAYQADLSKLVESFPQLLRPGIVHEEDIQREITSDLALRGQQIATKQRLGFVFDAYCERGQALTCHMNAHAFQLVGLFKDFFPES